MSTSFTSDPKSTFRYHIKCILCQLKIVLQVFHYKSVNIRDLIRLLVTELSEFLHKESRNDKCDKCTVL